MRAERTMSWLLAGLCFAVGLLWFLLEHPAGPTRDFEGFDMPQAPLSMQESVYRRLLESHPREASLHRRLAEVYRRMGLPGRAKRHLQQAESLQSR